MSPRGFQHLPMSAPLTFPLEVEIRGMGDANTQGMALQTHNIFSQWHFADSLKWITACRSPWHNQRTAGLNWCRQGCPCRQEHSWAVQVLLQLSEKGRKEAVLGLRLCQRAHTVHTPWDRLSPP